MLTLLRQAGVTQSLAMYQFFQNRIEHLYHILMPGHLAAASKIIDETKTTVFPTGSTEMQSFLVRPMSAEN